MQNELWEYIVTQISVVPLAVYEVLLSIFLIGLIVLLALYGRKAIRYILGLFFGEYLFIVYGLTFIFRKASPKVSHYLTPFWSYKRLFLEEPPLLLDEIIMNVVLFIPVGLLLGSIATKDLKKRQWLVVFLLGFCLSIGIELLQMLFKKGSFEIDDIIHNTIGCLLGFAAWKGFEKMLETIKNRKRNFKTT